MGVLSREKHPLQQLHTKRGVGVFSSVGVFSRVGVFLRVGLFSGDYGTRLFCENGRSCQLCAVRTQLRSQW